MADSPYGWRARAGLILPADNAVAEPELWGMGLPGISFHTLRLTTTEHDSMREQAVATASALEELAVDIVVYACAESSFSGGESTHVELSALLRAICTVPVVTATGAMIDAVQTLGLKRIALVTPYREPSGAELEKTFATHGIDVVSARHRDFRIEGDDPREWLLTNAQPPSVTYQMVRDTDHPEAEGVVVCATNLAFLGLLDQAELDLDKPIVSSNQSIVWALLTELGLKAPVPGYGRLLRASR